MIAAVKDALSAGGIDLPFPTRVVLLHDQTEESDGDRTRQREGWPQGDDPPRPRHLNEIHVETWTEAGNGMRRETGAPSPYGGANTVQAGAGDERERRVVSDGSIGSMLFDSWTGLGRVLLVGVLAYAALVLTLRISGKRTLTKLNAFDLVVTVALGSTLATVLLSKDVALAEGVLALALLVFLQFAITWASVRAPWFSGLIKSEPTLLVHRGAFLDTALRKQRVTREEILSVLRNEGVTAVAEAAAVVLETDGSFSVLKNQAAEPRASTLANVAGATEESAGK